MNPSCYGADTDRHNWVDKIIENNFMLKVIRTAKHTHVIIPEHELIHQHLRATRVKWES